MSIVSIIIFTAIALVLHELGHLVAARSCNVSASELGLGLGPKLFGVQFGSVRLNFRVLPLGSFVRIDGTALKQRTVRQQLNVHLGGIAFNLIAGLVTYGSIFGWINILIAAGNILPLYQHDGWKCGLVLMRAWLRRRSQPIEWTYTFSGGFASLLIVWLVFRAVV